MAPDQQERLALACVGLLEMFKKRPRWRPIRGNPRSLEYNDADISRRLEMLIDWWLVTDDIRFADAALTLAQKPPDGFSPWSDGDTLLQFFTRLRDRDRGRPFVYEAQFLAAAEKALIDMIGWQANSDGLSTLVDAVDAAGANVPATISSALADAVAAEFHDVESRVQDEDNESHLTDHIAALKKFAPRFGVSSHLLASAISTVEERISAIEERSASASSPDFSTPERQREKFDDEDLRNLFTPLLGE